MLNRTIQDQKYLSSAEAARVLGISEISLKRLRLAGEIDHYRPTPRVVLFTHEMIERFRSQRIARAKAA